MLTYGSEAWLIRLKDRERTLLAEVKHNGGYGYSVKYRHQSGLKCVFFKRNKYVESYR